MKTTAILSYQTQSLLEGIGMSIKVARKRRGDTLSQAAQRIGISRSNYERLEAGDAGVGTGTFLEALNVYGFSNQLFELTNPDNDLEGKALNIRKTLKK